LRADSGQGRSTDGATGSGDGDMDVLSVTGKLPVASVNTSRHVRLAAAVQLHAPGQGSRLRQPARGAFAMTPVSAAP
jgi:hypothetical protein